MCKIAPSAKRFGIATVLGIAFGLLCTYFASTENPDIWNIREPLMWSIVFNRFLIGLVIAYSGAFATNPVFGFHCFPWIRGPMLGALVSLDMAIGSLIAPAVEGAMTPQSIFLASIITGAVYGLIIDLVASKFGGQGKELLKT